MNAVVKPPWENKDPKLKATKEGPNRSPGNPNWYPGMKSPNPAGRPKGLTARSRLIQRMLQDGDGVIDAVIRKALEGDVGAASLVLSRIAPGIKPQMERVEFALDPQASTSKQLTQVLSAIAEGELAPDAGRHVIESIKAIADVRAAEDLEARIEALEVRNSHR